MSFSAVASQMLMLFLSMFAGFIARKINVMNDSVDGAISRLVMEITLPCMIVSSVFLGENLPDAHTILVILGCSCAAYTLIIAVAFLVPYLMKSPSDERGVYSFVAAFGNVAFIGFPVLASIFGPDAILYGAIANIPFNVTVFTIGAAFVATGKDGFVKTVVSNWRSLITPTQASCIIATILVLLRIKSGGLLAESLETIGSMTTPAALLIVGSTMAKFPPLDMLTNWRAYIATVFRLLVMPVLVFGLVSMLTTNQMVLGVLTVSSGMPVAAIGMMLCLKHDGNLKAMTQSMFTSTLGSILTIPLISMLVL